jgi:hypothetical protein
LEKRQGDAVVLGYNLECSIQNSVLSLQQFLLGAGLSENVMLKRTVFFISRFSYFQSIIPTQDHQLEFKYIQIFQRVKLLVPCRVLHGEIIFWLNRNTGFPLSAVTASHPSNPIESAVVIRGN